MSDIHALSGAYAVDALDDLERAQFERHIAGCDTCRSEVESLREASALLAETTIAAPSAALRARVLVDIATVRPLPPVNLPREHAAADPGRRRWVPALAAAAAAVVALGAGAIVTQPWADDTSQAPQVSAYDRILAAPDAQTYTDTIAGSEATIVRSQSLESAAIVPHGLPEAPDGLQYALWLQHDNKMVPAGLLTDTRGVVLSGDSATATGAAISLEQAGTNPTTPSDDVVALYDFGA